MMRSEDLRYEADGLAMVGRLFLPQSADRAPGVLVFPEAFGRDRQAVDRARRLAELGYVALAADLHGQGRVVNDLPTAVGLIAPLIADPLRARRRAEAAFRSLGDRPEVAADRIGALGFSVGGMIALELARSGANLKAVIGFHCPLMSRAAPSDVKPIKARVLVCLGADDDQIPPQDRITFEEVMRDAGSDWQLNVYGGAVHSFTNPEAAMVGLPDKVRYDRTADDASWAAAVHLLASTLKAA